MAVCATEALQTDIKYMSGIPESSVKQLHKTKLKNAVKGVCEEILKEGGLIKQVENLGQRELPHMIRTNGLNHRYGNYFCVQLECSQDVIQAVTHNYKQTNTILKFGVLRKEPERRRPCLDGKCLFGELPNPDHDRVAYTRNVLSRFRIGRMSNV